MQPIEQTICTKMMDPTDFSESDSVQAIFDHINIIVETCDILSQFFEQVKDPTFKAKMQKILQNHTEDANSSIAIISRSVSGLQSLQGQIERMAQSPAATENKSRETQHASISPEDDFFILGFITEANGHIKSAEAGLLELRTKPNDIEALNQIFRAFYTIKGMAGFLKLIEIGSLAHSTENLLDLVRKGKLKLEDKTIDVISESLDMLKNMIAELMESDKASKAVRIKG
jgi:two-component system, chemotaxis family, sensor kinase CheA